MGTPSVSSPSSKALLNSSGYQKKLLPLPDHRGAVYEGYLVTSHATRNLL